MVDLKVSVVVPAFNAERWLAETIQSVLNQTFTGFELIVVDDGSTDGTATVAKSFQDVRVRYIRQGNRGLSGARNTGIRAARGSIVAFLDADDLFHPQKLAQQMAAFENDRRVGGVVCGYETIDESGTQLHEERPWLSAPLIDLRTLLFWNPILPSALAVRRDLLFTAGLFDEKLQRYEDWDLPLRLASQDCRMVWVKEVLVAYRRHGQNMSTAAELVPVATDAAVGFMKRFFSHPGIPAEIRSLEGKVFGNLYLDAAARAFGAGLGEHGRRWLETAVERDPELADGYPPHWVVALCGHALGSLVKDW